MKKYDKYKNSGIGWLGEIPEHWGKGKLSFFTEVKDGTHDTPSYVDEGAQAFPLVTSKDLVSGKLDFSNCKYISQEDHKDIITRSNAKTNDLIMPMIGTVGSPVIVDTDREFSIKNVALFKTSNNSKFTPEFLNYVLNSDIIEEQFNLESRGGVQNFVSLSILRNLTVFILPKNEQTTIALYLDHKTTQIDTLIEKKEQLIEKLKLQRQAIINEAVTKGLNPNAPMKDSGIEWLGEIPEHWEMAKLKKICEAYGRIGYRGYTTSDIVDEGEGAITISPSNMKGDFMTFSDSTYISWEKYDESPEIKIYNDDILIVKTGSTYGKIGIVKNLNKKATINPQLLVLKNIQINQDYLFHVLRTPIVQNQVETEVIGSTIPTISQTKILNFSIPLPPRIEIEEILKYIEKKVHLIENSVDLIINQNKKLKLYRQSIISEAVTGKIDVRDWKNPENN